MAFLALSSALRASWIDSSISDWYCEISVSSFFLVLIKLVFCLEGKNRLFVNQQGRFYHLDSYSFEKKILLNIFTVIKNTLHKLCYYDETSLLYCLLPVIKLQKNPTWQNSASTDSAVGRTNYAQSGRAEIYYINIKNWCQICLISCFIFTDYLL